MTVVKTAAVIAALWYGPGLWLVAFGSWPWFWLWLFDVGYWLWILRLDSYSGLWLWSVSSILTLDFMWLRTLLWDLDVEHILASQLHSSQTYIAQSALANVICQETRLHLSVWFFDDHQMLRYVITWCAPAAPLSLLSTALHHGARGEVASERRSQAVHIWDCLAL